MALWLARVCELMASTGSIWVVVLTYNGLDDTRKCLTSVAPLVRPGVKVLLVDNGSNDSTHERVSREFPWCDVLRLDANVGPAGGNNAGIRRALGAGAQWIVLLNNDTTVAPGLVDRLAEAAAAHPELQHSRAGHLLHVRAGHRDDRRLHLQRTWL